MMIVVQLLLYQNIYVCTELISRPIRCAGLQRMRLEIFVYFILVLIFTLMFITVTQDLSLYVEFTIRETFLYFGWVNGMTTEEIDEKIHFLLKFLQLPSANRFVKTLRLEPSVLCQQYDICAFVPWQNQQYFCSLLRFHILSCLRVFYHKVWIKFEIRKQ